MANANLTTGQHEAYDMATDDLLRWIPSLARAVEVMAEHSPGAPDADITHLAQITQYLVAQHAKEQVA